MPPKPAACPITSCCFIVLRNVLGGLFDPKNFLGDDHQNNEAGMAPKNS